jgi:hypothetical protein
MRLLVNKLLDQSWIPRLLTELDLRTKSVAPVDGF